MVSSLLGRIARNIANAQQRGVWLVFFNLLDRVLTLGLCSLDVLAHIDGQYDCLRALEAKSKVRKV